MLHRLQTKPGSPYPGVTQQSLHRGTGQSPGWSWRCVPPASVSPGRDRSLPGCGPDLSEQYRALYLVPLPMGCARSWCAASAAERVCLESYQECGKIRCRPNGSLPGGVPSRRARETWSLVGPEATEEHVITASGGTSQGVDGHTGMGGIPVPLVDLRTKAERWRTRGTRRAGSDASACGGQNIGEAMRSRQVRAKIPPVAHSAARFFPGVSRTRENEQEWLIAGLAGGVGLSVHGLFPGLKPLPRGLALLERRSAGV